MEKTFLLVLGFFLGFLFIVTTENRGKLKDEEKIIIGCDYIGGELSYYPQTKKYYCTKEKFNITK